MLSADDAWAVGEYHHQGSALLHNDGGGWQVVGNPLTHTLRAIDMLSDANGWVVGGDYRHEPAPIFHFDGSQLVRAASPTTGTLLALDMIGDSAGWAAGSSRSGTQGVMAQYDGASWTSVPLPSGAGALNDLEMIVEPGGGSPTATDGWAVGNQRTLLRYNSSSGQWEDAAALLDDADSFDFYALHMVSADEGWLVGATDPFDAQGTIMQPHTYHGVIFHFDGSSWERVFAANDFMEGFDLRDIHMVSADEGWIVGDHGVILHYGNGQWQLVSELDNLHYNAIAMAGGNSRSNGLSGWVVGGSGLKLRTVGRGQQVFLPNVRRDPPPTPPPTPTSTPTPIPTPVPPTTPPGTVLYEYDFGDGDYYNHPDRRWPTFKTDGEVGGNCDFVRHNGHYTLELDRFSLFRCFRFAPAAAEYEYGEFEATLRLSSGSDDTEYGLYINGHGGSEHYLFRVRPGRDCGWDVIKRRDNHNETIARPHDWERCDHINRYHESNRLRIAHIRRDSSHILAFWLNGVYLGKYTDHHHSLHGRGTGVYAFPGNPEAADVYLEHFKVLSPP
jgi:hypothetical protein